MPHVGFRIGRSAFQADDAGSIPVGRSEMHSQVKPNI